MMHADLRGCFFAGAIMAGANLFEADLRPGAHVTRDKAGDFKPWRRRNCLVPPRRRASRGRI